MKNVKKLMLSVLLGLFLSALPIGIYAYQEEAGGDCPRPPRGCTSGGSTKVCTPDGHCYLDCKYNC